MDQNHYTNCKDRMIASDNVNNLLLGSQIPFQFKLSFVNFFLFIINAFWNGCSVW